MLPINLCIFWRFLVNMFWFICYALSIHAFWCLTYVMYHVFSLPWTCLNYVPVFLLTSWCHGLSLLLIDPCLFWICSNYMFWIMLWVMCTEAKFDNFVLHMPLFQACKHAILMLLFYTCWNCFNIQYCLVGSHKSMSHMYMMLWCYLCFVMCALMPCYWLPCIVVVASSFHASNMPSY